ncbi:hypothetical protein [Mycobacterium decipiens]|uniref:Uncharacterized protein n=1 Tax=Mycobacterium decipiens TaxID=1430326 RepID=A0A1X2LVD6_9MYCO|nr:hypothetical protein [Mycobacterium decipiens]OSC41043.1 hypothetical protein B8W66_09790 [Mycobacterium decipiens]
MHTTAGTDPRARIRVTFVVAAVVAVTPMLPVQWRAIAKRAWSFGVYYVGYRLLSVQLSCGSLAVSGIPFVAKYRLS